MVKLLRASFETASPDGAKAWRLGRTERRLADGAHVRPAGFTLLEESGEERYNDWFAIPRSRFQEIGHGLSRHAIEAASDE